MPLDKNNIEPSQITTASKNRGMPFEKHILNDLRVNLSAVERRCSTLLGRRTVKRHNQAGWLLRAISCMDLTTLSGDDTEDRVKAFKSRI